MSIETTQEVDETFQQIWDQNFASDIHPAVIEGYEAIATQQNDPEGTRSTVYITDVTLRDGQQQRTDVVSTEQRVDVFDAIVQTGVDRIEIGHLGNSNGDQQLATEIVRQVAARESEDERYRNIKLQVLFGSQEALIKDGIRVLEEAFQEQYGEGWQAVMADKVVVHVYDRLDENLRNTSSTPYSDAKSAERISHAAQHAIDAGFKHFSISAEAATAETPETAIQFYRAINAYLIEQGAETVNVNLANTYGYSPNTTWNTATLAIFDTAVKHGFDSKVTTSIHMHNDVNNAVDFTMAAIVAGFDRVEGTHTGMGERAGNVASTDVVARILEQAKHAIDTEKRPDERQSHIASYTGHMSLRRMVAIDESVATNFAHWYRTGEVISEVFGEHAAYRWRRTTIGNPYEHDNGSGPHDQAMAAAVIDPIKNPAYGNYEWFLSVAKIMGRPGTAELAIGDPKMVDEVTVGNHAGGGKTRAIKEGALIRANESTIVSASERFNAYTTMIAERAVSGVVIVAA